MTGTTTSIKYECYYNSGDLSIDDEAFLACDKAVDLNNSLFAMVRPSDFIDGNSINAIRHSVGFCMLVPPPQPPSKAYLELADNNKELRKRSLGIYYI